MKIATQMPNDYCKMIFPFLWKSDNGCIYMRTREHCDIIIAPLVPDDKVGVVANHGQSDTYAWTRRLPTGFRVTFEQT